jgi:hypothetical protein
MPMQSGSGSATLPAAAEVGRMMQTYRAAGEHEKGVQINAVEKDNFLMVSSFPAYHYCCGKSLRASSQR